VSDLGFTHLNEHGHAHMVDVTAKAVTMRRAEARALFVSLINLTQAYSQSQRNDLVAGARIAGIMAAKKTATLIPLCHPIGLDEVDLAVEQRDEFHIAVYAYTGVAERTGVEMECLSACIGAGLYLVSQVIEDDPLCFLDEIALWHKSGGRSGTFDRHKLTTT
jgi:cyclic pyranopterin phosphate synthase